MKTILDAVNGLKGDLENSFNFYYGGGDSLFYCDLRGGFGFYLPHDKGGKYTFACTVKEFNAIVAEMSLGLDVNSVTHGELFNYVNADKTLLKKEFEVDYTSKEFWKDAPEDANYYWEPSKSFYKFSDCEEDFVFDNDEWVPCCDIFRFLGDDLFERPQSTPIETPEEKEALDKIFVADSAPKPIRTVWDAVNRLRGDVNNSPVRHRGDEDYILYYKPAHIYVTSTNNTTSVEHQYICNIAEFNALVTEMSLGLDVNPVNEGYYHEYLDADKDELEPIKQDLIYTQEMCDNGELPSVGMWVVARYNHDSKTVTHKGTLKYLSGSIVILDINGVEWHGLIGDYVIEPTPPKLELIDGEAYQFDYNTGSIGMNNVVMRYNKYIKAFQFDNHTLKPEHCTNIKQLIVK